MKGYPFDLKRALAGDAVCDTNGTPVTGLHAFEGVTPGERTLYGVHRGDLSCWWDDGIYRFSREECTLDLRMVTDGGATLQQEMAQALKALVSAVPNLPVRQRSIEDTQLLNEGENAMELARAVLAKVDANVGS